MKLIPIKEIPVKEQPKREGKYDSILREFEGGHHNNVKLDFSGESIGALSVYATVKKAISRTGLTNHIGVAVRKGNIFLFKKEPN